MWASRGGGLSRVTYVTRMCQRVMCTMIPTSGFGHITKLMEKS